MTDATCGGARRRAGVLALFAATALALGSPPAAAQREAGTGDDARIRRPVPAPVVPPPFFRRAVDAGTRTSDGRPGPDYWRQSTAYEIDARLDPRTGQLSGGEVVRYRNRSPDTLRVLVMKVHQNLHRRGTVRNEAQEITGGVDLERVAVNGTELHPRGMGPGPSYRVNATTLVLRPERPVAPGETAEIEVDWGVTLPQSGAGRMGWSEREVYFVAYWFPKMAVYDDLRGWDAEPYLGGAEFYDGFADYRVSLTVPAEWTVMSTGRLQNPGEVWSQETRRRLEAAFTSDTVVVVADDEDRRRNAVTAETRTGYLTYRYRAVRVRDFAWTTSNVQRWSATSARVPDRDGDGVEDRVAIHSFWRQDRAPLWNDQALYGKHAIEHHSRYTGFAYPWSHMTSVEGSDIIGGGMEFPMLTVIGPYTGRGAEDLYNVTSHELAHMWIPMIVGTNEKRHAWMDEGSTSFLENQGRPEYWPDTRAHTRERDRYLRVARAELEEPLMRHGDYYAPGPSYGTASYSKPATLLVTLRTLLGPETFRRAYRGFIDDWAYRHPTPWDFFNAFERAVGRELDWFWTSWYYETWTLDHAVAGVSREEEGPVVVVEDRGWVPMPVRLSIETTEGGTLRRTVPVDRWLDGRVSARVALPASVGRVTRVEIDPDRGFPDVERSNNVWSRDGGSGPGG